MPINFFSVSRRINLIFMIFKQTIKYFKKLPYLPCSLTFLDENKLIFIELYD